MKTRGLVYHGKPYWAPYGAAAPAVGLPDVSRYQNDGTFGAGDKAPTWTQLPSGLWVMSFDGAKNLLTIPAHACINNPYAFTVEFWAKHDALAVNDYIFNHNYGVAIYGKAGTNYRLDVDTSAGNHATQMTTAVTLGVWNYFVFTYDSAGGANNKNIYYNLVATLGTHTGTIDDKLGDDLMIGNQTAVSDGYGLDGMMALLRIYDYALDIGTMGKHYAAERHLFGV